MENTEKVSSKKFNFYLKGNNGKAVLLVHGITGTPSEMHFLGKALNKAGFSVLCNTLPRHCETLKELKKVKWQELADFCAKDFEALKNEHSEVYVGGLSMGALMAMHLAYLFPGSVSGIIALAPTLFYDGWAVPKTKFLMDILWHFPVFRDNIDIKENWPYGLKDEVLRNNIERFYRNAKPSTKDEKIILFGSPFFPMVCLYQHHLFTTLVKEELKGIKTPIIIFHAREDDMTSLKNAQYVYDNIASTDKSLLILNDSYHMVTIDRERDKVAEEIVKFLNKAK